MADPVALTSVVASGLVAVTAFVTTYRSGSEQRRHQERLALESRTWQTRSEGLLDLVATCRALVDSIDRPGDFETVEALDTERGDYQATAREHIGVSEVGVRVGDAVERLQRLVPVVEVFASAECRDAFHELRGLLKDSGYDPRASDRLEAVRRGKVAAVDAKDYRSAATARRLEREILDDARARLTIDLSQARAGAVQVIETARESLGGDA